MQQLLPNLFLHKIEYSFKELQLQPNETTVMCPPLCINSLLVYIRQIYSHHLARTACGAEQCETQIPNIFLSVFVSAAVFELILDTIVGLSEMGFTLWDVCDDPIQCK